MKHNEVLGMHPIIFGHHAGTQAVGGAWRRRARLLQALVLAPVAAQGAHVASVGSIGAGAAVQLLCQALELPLPRLTLLH